MDRRAAVKSVAFLIGGALSATTIGVFLDSCNSPSTKQGELPLTKEQHQILDELADMIIPDTKTPGAKAAGVGPFIAMMMNDCYPEDAQKVFQKGLVDLEELSKKESGASFLKLTPKEREPIMAKLREQTLAAQKVDREKNDYHPHFFPLVRDLTILGYFTSEIGATQAYEYLDIPGRYDGCVDLKPGQRVWATS